MNLAADKKSIGFIGAGIMGASLIRGLLSSSIKANQIYISEKNLERAAEVTSQFNVENLSLSQITQKCEVIFLSVKPQDLENVLKEISSSLKNDTLVISIAAGKTSKFIETLLKSKNPVVRVMPNTPAQIGKGVSVISAGSFATKADLDLTKELLSSTGLVLEVDESQQDAVTAVSGSGPAYFLVLLSQ